MLRAQPCGTLAVVIAGVLALVTVIVNAAPPLSLTWPLPLTSTLAPVSAVFPTPLVVTHDSGSIVSVAVRAPCVACLCHAHLSGESWPLHVEHTQHACVVRFNCSHHQGRRPSSASAVLAIDAKPDRAATREATLLNDEEAADGESDSDGRTDVSELESPLITDASADLAEPNDAADADADTDGGTRAPASNDESTEFVVSATAPAAPALRGSVPVTCAAAPVPGSHRELPSSTGLIAAWSSRFQRFTLNNQRRDVARFELSAVDDLELACREARGCTLCTETCQFSIGSFVSILSGTWSLSSAVSLTSQLRVDDGATLVIDHPPSLHTMTIIDARDEHGASKPIELEGALIVRRGRVLLRSAVTGNGVVVVSDGAELILDAAVNGAMLAPSVTSHTNHSRFHSSGAVTFTGGSFAARISDFNITGGRVSVDSDASLALVRFASDSVNATEWHMSSLSASGALTLVNVSLSIEASAVKASSLSVSAASVLSLSLSDVGSHVQSSAIDGALIVESGQLELGAVSFGPATVAINRRASLSLLSVNASSSSGPRLITNSGQLKIGAPLSLEAEQFDQSNLGTTLAASEEKTSDNSHEMHFEASSERDSVYHFHCALNTPCTALSVPSDAVFVAPRVTLRIGANGEIKAHELQSQGLVELERGARVTVQSLSLVGDSSALIMQGARVQQADTCNCERATIRGAGLVQCQRGVSLMGCGIQAGEMDAPLVFEGPMSSDDATVWRIALNQSYGDKASERAPLIRFVPTARLRGRLVVHGSLPCTGQSACSIPLIAGAVVSPQLAFDSSLLDAPGWRLQLVANGTDVRMKATRAQPNTNGHASTAIRSIISIASAVCLIELTAALLA